MPVQIHAPDGTIVQFPDGTSDETIMSVMRKHYGGPKHPASPESISTATDVAKSAGIGLVQGGLGLASLPGNVELLGRAAINKVGDLAGHDGPVVRPDSFLPNYNDFKAEVEKYTGPFYQPKTVAGEYARTAGEFAPAAVGGGGGVLSRVARVAVPATASETAGQATKGTALEPWARVGGALLAGRVANAGQRAVTPLPVDSARAAAVRTLENEGVTALTAGQRTGRKALQWAEAATQDTPGSGGRAARMAADQATQFTRAALRRIGVNADRADPPTMETAYRNIGQRFEGLTQRNNLVPTRYFMNRLQTIGNQYNAVTAPPMRAPIVEQVITALRDPSIRQNGVIPGRLYQNYRSSLGRAERSLRKSDPNAANAVRDIIEALDRTMEISIRAFRGNNAADLGAFRQVRNQYRNYLAIEDAVSRAGPGVEGIITPANLRAATQRQGRRAYVQGRGDFNELARAGDLVMKPLPNSGTAPRANAMHTLGVIGGVAVGSPYPAVASLFGPALGSRVLMSRPVQDYLANQSINPTQAAIPMANAPTRGLLALPEAIDDRDTPPLRGGIGPRYDIFGNPIQ